MNRYSNDRDRTANVKHGGTGIPARWRCLHCGQVRSMTGSRGAGIRKRCAQCVAARCAA